MPRPHGLARFNELAGVPCYYARVNAAYSNIKKATKSRTRYIHRGYKPVLDALVEEIKWVCMGAMGPMKAIVSGGAYVAKAGKHGEGKAYDFGAFHFSLESVVCLPTAVDYHDHGIEECEYRRYLGIEAILWKHQGMTLGLHFNPQHWNHWHVNNYTIGCWSTGFGCGTRIKFLQAALKTIWGLYSGKIDGDAGPKTIAATKAMRKLLNLPPFIPVRQADLTIVHVDAWKQFLLMTAMRAFYE